jgi:hypothetical protein
MATTSAGPDSTMEAIGQAVAEGRAGDIATARQKLLPQDAYGALLRNAIEQVAEAIAQRDTVRSASSPATASRTHDQISGDLAAPAHRDPLDRSSSRT